MAIKEQPKSPKYEGVDPLADGDHLHDRENTKAESEALTEKLNNTAPESDNTTVDEQEERNAEANTPDTSEDKPDEKPADTQESDVAHDAEQA